MFGGTMKLSPQLKEFLSRQYILDMIDKNQWNEFYNAVAEFGWNTISDVTEFLRLRCQIDPLPYMNYVPPYYREKDNSLTELILHEGIETIYERAFMDCHNLTKVVLPASCDKVQEFVFKGCTNLRTVHIRGAKTNVDPLAFCFLDNIEFFINKNNEDMISLFSDTLKYNVHVIRGTTA
jgi:hypothetical protein